MKKTTFFLFFVMASLNAIAQAIVSKLILIKSFNSNGEITVSSLLSIQYINEQYR